MQRGNKQDGWSIHSKWCRELHCHNPQRQLWDTLHFGKLHVQNFYYNGSDMPPYHGKQDVQLTLLPQHVLEVEESVAVMHSCKNWQSGSTTNSVHAAERTKLQPRLKGSQVQSCSLSAQGHWGPGLGHYSSQWVCSEGGNCVPVARGTETRGWCRSWDSWRPTDLVIEAEITLSAADAKTSSKAASCLVTWLCGSWRCQHIACQHLQLKGCTIHSLSQTQRRSYSTYYRIHLQ